MAKIKKKIYSIPDHKTNFEGMVFNFNKKDILKINKTTDFLVIGLLFLVSIGPYLLVQKSTDLFSFVDYEGRHAFTVSLSFAILFTIIIKKIFESFFNKQY